MLVQAAKSDKAVERLYSKNNNMAEGFFCGRTYMLESLQEKPDF